MAYGTTARTAATSFEYIGDNATFFSNTVITIGGFFRPTESSETTFGPWFTVNRGSTNEAYYSLGMNPASPFAFEYQVANGGSTSGSGATVDTTSNNWWFAALRVTSATDRQIFYQLQGDTDNLLSYTADTSSFTYASSLDSVQIGVDRNFADKEQDVEIFQLGIADGVAMSTAELQKWANGQRVSTLTDITHAWNLEGTSDITVGNTVSADVGGFALTAVGGTVTGIANPFTPTTGASGGVITGHTAGPGGIAGHGGIAGPHGGIAG